jgi:hypothetical protein
MTDIKCQGADLYWNKCSGSAVQFILHKGSQPYKILAFCEKHKRSEGKGNIYYIHISLEEFLALEVVSS